MIGPRRKRFIVVIAAVLAFGLALGLGALVGPLTPGSGPARQAQDGIGAAARARATDLLNVEFARLEGGGTARLSDWAGTPMVVNFWASWCPPCVAEMREAFEPAHQDYGDRVAFVGLNLQDQPAQAAAVLDATGASYDMGVDPEGDLFAAFGGLGMPTTVLIDADGAVVAKHTGALTRDQLDGLVAEHFGVG